MEIKVFDESRDKADLVRPFAPDFDDNRELPRGKRAEVDILPMSGRELVKAEQGTYLKTRADRKIKDPLASVSRREHLKMIAILEERVVGFRNWSRVNEKGEVTEIKNAKDWINMLLASRNARHALILSNVYDAIHDESVLDEGVLGE
jgi:hypothetical protein